MRNSPLTLSMTTTDVSKLKISLCKPNVSLQNTEEKPNNKFCVFRYAKKTHAKQNDRGMLALEPDFKSIETFIFLQL